MPSRYVIAENDFVSANRLIELKIILMLVIKMLFIIFGLKSRCYVLSYLKLFAMCLNESSQVVDILIK